MLTEVYRKTTNPQTSLLDIYTDPRTWFSIVFHTLLYTFSIHLAKYAFTGQPFSVNTNTRIVILLLAIMTAGYAARYARVQEIHRAYQQNPSKTQEHCDKAFITWFFLG